MDASSSRRRDRSQTESRILNAVGEVLGRDGFQSLGVNAIAKQADVDKVLIYRYFGGLPQLLRAWAGSGRFWPPIEEIVGVSIAELATLPLPKRLILLVEGYVDALRRRPLTIEILAAEIFERNELVIILEEERERWSEQLAAFMSGDELARYGYWRAVALMLMSSVQYLLIRARTIRVYGGIDLRSDQGWEMLKGSVRALVHEGFRNPD